MKLIYIKFYISATVIFSSFSAIAQETLPLFSDYLSDNVYLLHPAAAGVGSCGKIRVTAGNYWKGNELQTASFHSKFDEYSKAAFGIILFNDKNGYHSQKGFQGTYAYHINMSNDGKFEQLSFGVSLLGVQNQVDQRAFFNDPIVQQLIKSKFYVNGDFGMAYHYGGLSSYFTVKNLFLSAKNNINNNFNALNLRNYILGAGYFFGNKEKFQFEPSFMLQYKERSGEKIADFNMKVYKTLENENFQLWGALSYRRNFDGNPIQELQQITPIIGINYKRWMISYTYTKQLGDFQFATGGFHQVTIGINLLCGRTDAAACPNINNSF